MTEPAGDGPDEAGGAVLAGMATSVLGIFMILAAIAGAIYIAVQIGSADRQTSMIGGVMMLLLGPEVVIGFVAGRFYRRAGRQACEAGQWTTDLWRAGLTSLALAALMALSLHSRIDTIWDGLAVVLKPLRHVNIAVLALHGLLIGIFGRPRNSANG